MNDDVFSARGTGSARRRSLYKIVTGGTPCEVATFSDQIANVPKPCQVSDELYTACANEGQPCTFSGTKQLRFGLNGQWLTRTATNSTPSDAATFGDPLPHVLKRCGCRDAP